VQESGLDILLIGVQSVHNSTSPWCKIFKRAQKGVMFAAYLKLLMPLVIVLPGICAAVLFPVLEKTDQAYPTMMIELLP
jgi:uncharacterized sodium:solute symporter family permease YidK